MKALRWAGLPQANPTGKAIPATLEKQRHTFTCNVSHLQLIASAAHRICSSSHLQRILLPTHLTSNASSMRAAIYHLLALFLVPVIGQAEAVAQTTGESQQAPSPRYSYVHHSSSGGSSFEENSFGDNSFGDNSSSGSPSSRPLRIGAESRAGQGLRQVEGHSSRRTLPVNV